MSLAAAPSGRLLPAVWKLLVLRLRINWNSFRHARIGRKILTVLGLLGLLAFAAGIFIGSWLLLGFLNSPLLKQYAGLDPAPFLQAVPVLILTILFMSILVSSFGVLLQGLYLSGDMDFLLTSPVPMRAVFVAKMLQAVLPNFGFISLFGLPVLFGLGLSSHYNFLYYPLVPLTMILLTLAAAGLSGLLVMLVVRVLPPRRAAEILGFVGATLGFACSQSGNLFNAFRNDVDISGTQVNGVFTALTRFNTPWLPLNWAGQGLVALGSGHWLTGVLLTAATLGGAALAFWLALAGAERFYYSGWAGMQVVVRKRRPARAARLEAAAGTGPVPWAARLLPSPVRGLLRKDFLVLTRDLRNLAGLVTPLIVGLIYGLMLLRSGGQPPPGRGEAPDAFINSFRILLSYGNVAISLFVGLTLLSRLSGMGFSSEGKNYWILKASPVRPGHLLLAKFLVAYLPALTLGWFFLVGMSIMQKFTLAGFLYNLLAVTSCLAGMNGILLASGVMGANFTWEDPRRMNAGTLGCLGQIAATLFVALGFGLFVGPLWLAAAFHLPQVVGYLAGLVLGVLVNATAAFLPPWLVRKRVERLGEA
jgi:hypothetical protein